MSILAECVVLPCAVEDNLQPRSGAGGLQAVPLPELLHADREDKLRRNPTIADADMRELRFCKNLTACRLHAPPALRLSCTR